MTEHSKAIHGTGKVGAGLGDRLRKLSRNQRLALFCLIAITVFWIGFGWRLTAALEEKLREGGGLPAPELVPSLSRTIWFAVGFGWFVVSGIVLGFFWKGFRRMDSEARDMEDMSLQLIRSMVNVVDSQNSWTHGHSERTARYAVRIARKMGLDQETIKDLKLASLLHDVGTVVPSNRVQDKPEELTEEERDTVRQQPTRGEQILEGASQFRRIVPVIRSYRERYDGTGYPDAVGGEKIPVLARIVHVAEAYDAMVEDRPYRSGSGPKYAREELIRHSGTQFDPKVVDAFLKVLGSKEKAEE